MEFFFCKNRRGTNSKSNAKKMDNNENKRRRIRVRRSREKKELNTQIVSYVAHRKRDSKASMHRGTHAHF